MHFALDHPDRFGAAIGLQAGGHVQPYYGMQWLYRPDVHGEFSAAVVSGLIGPDGTDENRSETLWHYMQGGRGVFRGDLYFYKVDGDIRSRAVGDRYNVLPGPPVDGRVRLQLHPRRHDRSMPALGHFPMSENPEAFLAHLRPVLARILEERRR